MESTEKTPENVMPAALQAFYKLAKMSMILLANLLPPGANLTLLARWDDGKDGNPILLSTDKLEDVERTIHKINNPANTGEYKIFYSNPALNGRPH